ncbi:MAG: hypothetical protein Q8N63_01950 [Nanoarchaeota archaeon]|nr:hypothetical protein [Nanoarchaeota archaeon]
MQSLADKHSISAGKKKLRNSVRRNIEIFIKELEKRSEGLDSSEDDLIDELRCEIDVYRKYHSEEEVLGYFRTIRYLEKGDVRRDLVERAFNSYNEPQVREELAGILKRIRITSNNGLKYLSRNQQYNQLRSWLSDIRDILGTDNLYFSNKRDEKGRLIPLRKDVTRYAFLKILDLFEFKKERELDLSD